MRQALKCHLKDEVLKGKTRTFNIIHNRTS